MKLTLVNTSTKFKLSGKVGFACDKYNDNIKKTNVINMSDYVHCCAVQCFRFNALKTQWIYI